MTAAGEMGFGHPSCSAGTNFIDELHLLPHLRTPLMLQRVADWGAKTYLMRKAPPPAHTLEAIPLFALLFVPLVPDCRLAHGVHREDALELRQRQPHRIGADLHAPACMDNYIRPRYSTSTRGCSIPEYALFGGGSWATSVFSLFLQMSSGFDAFCVFVPSFTAPMR